MRSNRSMKLLAITMTAVLAACSDANVSPTAPAAESGPRLDIIINNMAADLSSADFTVTNTGGTFQMGPHAIYFPAQSICEAATSTYGPTEWDNPCTADMAPVRIHAALRTVDGYEWVEFTPALRFVPTKGVMIYMRADALKTNPGYTLNILWTPTDGVASIDESLTDPTLKTYVMPTYGILFRRIKHFSGYQVSAGVADILVDAIPEGIPTQ